MLDQSLDLHTEKPARSDAERSAQQRSAFDEIRKQQADGVPVAA